LDLVFARLTFLTGPEANRFFYEAKDNLLNFNKALEMIAKNVFGPEWDANDPKWMAKANTYIVAGFRKHDRLRMFEEFTKSEVRKHVLEWSKADKIDLFASVSRLVTFVNIRCMLGKDIYAAHADEIAEIYYEMEKSAMDTLAIMLPNAPLPVLYRLKAARLRFIDIVTKCFDKRTSDPEHHDDYLSMIYGKEKENHSFILFVMHVLGVMFAAHTNTAGMPSWIIAHLAKNQHMQEKAHEEQLAMDNNAEHNHPYLDALLTESGRCYGSLSLVRVALDDAQVTLRGKTLTIPKGSTVLASPMVSHTDPEVYPEPEEFRPERWLEPGKKQRMAADRQLHMWGFGTHQCLGDRYAKAAMKPLLAHITREYKVELVSPVDVPPADWSKQAGVPQPVAPIWVRVRPLE
jgi:sterol 14-demethylase